MHQVIFVIRWQENAIGTVVISNASLGDGCIDWPRDKVDCPEDRGSPANGDHMNECYCKCKKGWAGPGCRNIDHCEMSGNAECRLGKENGAKLCVNTANGFKCECDKNE